MTRLNWLSDTKICLQFKGVIWVAQPLRCLIPTIGDGRR